MNKKILCAVIASMLLCSMNTVCSQAKETPMVREDLNIVFAVDHSGSMNEQDADGMISQVLALFVDTMHGESIRMGYLAYNDTIIAQRMPVSVQEETEREELKQIMASAVNQGETDIGLGLREAYHLMDGYSGKKMVVLISDGETDLTRSDTGRTREDSDQDIAETIHLCRDEGTPVVTVGFGTFYEGEEDGLKKISDSTGGESYEAQRPEELVSILYDLFHTEFSYFVKEISDSVYDQGSQKIICETDGVVCDEMAVALFSNQEIGEAVIVSDGEETEARDMGNYAVARLKDGQTEYTIRFETKQGQQMAVFLIGRRMITPVLEISGDIYKNKEVEFRINFMNGSGGRLLDMSSYGGFSWQAYFQNLSEQSMIPVDIQETQTGLVGSVVFPDSGRYRLWLNSGRNVENTYEVSELTVLNTLPEVKGNDRVELLTLSGEQMLDLEDYFVDADGDILSFTLQELPQDVVFASVENHYLHIVPRSRGAGDIVVIASDGEGSLKGHIPVRVRVWAEAYPAVPLLVIGLLMFAVFKIYQRKKRVIVIPEKIEENNKYYFTGKLNAYFTLLPQDIQEIPPLTFALHHIRDGRIVLGDMFTSYPELSGLLELDHIYLYPAENRKIIFYHNAKTSIMIGNSIACRKMQYAVSYGCVIYITAQDESCELEIHYVSTM